MSTFTAEIRSGRVAANALIRAPRAAARAAGGPATPPRITTPRYCDPAARARSACAPRTAGESGGNSSSSSGRSRSYKRAIRRAAGTADSTARPSTIGTSARGQRLDGARASLMPPDPGPPSPPPPSGTKASAPPRRAAAASGRGTRRRRSGAVLEHQPGDPGARRDRQRQAVPTPAERVHHRRAARDPGRAPGARPACSR